MTVNTLTGFVLAQLATGGLAFFAAPQICGALLQLRYPQPHCTDASSATDEIAAPCQSTIGQEAPRLGRADIGRVVGGATPLLRIAAGEAAPPAPDAADLSRARCPLSQAGA